MITTRAELVAILGTPPVPEVLAGSPDAETLADAILQADHNRAVARHSRRRTRGLGKAAQRQWVDDYVRSLTAGER